MWRARHSLANVDALKDTLRQLGKRDIVDNIERRRSKAAHGVTKAHAKVNWKKLKKFKATFGKIMALQTQTHRNKLDPGSRPRGVALDHKTLFGVVDDTKVVKTGRINLKNSNIILKRPPKKRVLPSITAPRVKAH